LILLLAVNKTLLPVVNKTLLPAVNKTLLLLVVKKTLLLVGSSQMAKLGIGFRAFLLVHRAPMCQWQAQKVESNQVRMMIQTMMSTAHH
jgi:hypothetical protein